MQSVSINFTGIPSGPVDLFEPMKFSICRISYSVVWIFSSKGGGGVLTLLSGGS